MATITTPSKTEMCFSFDPVFFLHVKGISIFARSSSSNVKDEIVFGIDFWTIYGEWMLDDTIFLVVLWQGLPMVLIPKKWVKLFGS
ncbi:hypothetical protein VNO77_44572 [Canavalia gladiata]|uniref:Uncharacterized protein n=1 Tax=Canavalia gladiata TaxID=3824 RepID=A0AAN9PQG4_CANGL